MRHLQVYDNWEFVKNGSRVHAEINAGTHLTYYFMENLILYNTSKFQVGGGLESADIGVLVRGVKNENFPCPARLRALKIGVRSSKKKLDELFFNACHLEIYSHCTKNFLTYSQSMTMKK